jgi:hypothetical protein
MTGLGPANPTITMAWVRTARAPRSRAARNSAISFGLTAASRTAPMPVAAYPADACRRPSTCSPKLGAGSSCSTSAIALSSNRPVGSGGVAVDDAAFGGPGSGR